MSASSRSPPVRSITHTDVRTQGHLSWKPGVGWQWFRARPSSTLVWSKESQMDTDQTLSLVLFSGTDDKLQAAAVLAVGAAVMGRQVNVFLQYWALDAFRADRI